MRLGTTPPLSTGAGRKTSKPPAVPSVEDLPCSRGGNHVLANSAQRGGLVTACVGCGSSSWAEIDAAVRAR
jgi:hypothetical protein